MSSSRYFQPTTAGQIERESSGEKLDRTSLFNYSCLLLISNKLYCMKTGKACQGSRANVSEKEGYKFKTQLQTFLCGVCLFSLCMRGFSLCTSFHPNTRNKHFRFIVDSKLFLFVNSCHLVGRLYCRLSGGTNPLQH